MNDVRYRGPVMNQDFRGGGGWKQESATEIKTCWSNLKVPGDLKSISGFGGLHHRHITGVNMYL